MLRRIPLLIISGIVLASFATFIYIVWVFSQGMKQYDMAINLGQSILAHDYHQAETLLRAGADPNLADTHDSLLFAISEKDETMLALLRRYGVKSDFVV